MKLPYLSHAYGSSGCGCRKCLEIHNRKSAIGNSAFTLIEILVVSVLLTVIILGLLAMFQQTQKAFRVGLTQTDVLESGRATTYLLARELEHIRPANGNATNFFAWIPNGLFRHEQNLPGPPKDTFNVELTRWNYLEEMFFLTRSNQYWIGIGYRVGGPAIGSGIGSLYRYETNSHINAVYVQGGPPSAEHMLQDFLDQPLANLSRIADGVVHFKIQAYDLKGILLTNEVLSVSPSVQIPDTIIKMSSGNYAPGQVGYYQMANKTVPAFVDFELAILEPRAQERVRALSDVPSAAAAYLEQQAGRVHVFRQRVTVRNVDPSVYP